mmetsp:Transcript_82024/g.206370  ORF Transcript_82024/g.206370 Transcript_82024/m.206370 type:complete len:211 (+) Transcript_82024:264-896(+)
MMPWLRLESSTKSAVRRRALSLPALLRLMARSKTHKSGRMVNWRSGSRSTPLWLLVSRLGWGLAWAACPLRPSLSMQTLWMSTRMPWMITPRRFMITTRRFTITRPSSWRTAQLLLSTPSRRRLASKTRQSSRNPFATQVRRCSPLATPTCPPIPSVHKTTRKSRVLSRQGPLTARRSGNTSRGCHVCCARLQPWGRTAILARTAARALI